MGTAIEYSLTANGHDVSYLQNVIEARKKELGETSQQAATATAIQVLKSLRANTKVANPKDMNLTVKKSNQFFVGWKTKGKRRSRCVRIGSPKGQEINSKSVKDIAGLYIKGEKVTVYSVVDIVEGSKKRSEHYLILAKVEKDAMDFAKKRHINRVKRYSGMARFALTLAMMKTSGKRSSDGAKTGKLG